MQCCSTFVKDIPYQENHVRLVEPFPFHQLTLSAKDIPSKQSLRHRVRSTLRSKDTSIQHLPPKSSHEYLPYFVQRTASKELPVYHTVKAGGTLHLTYIRKVHGNRSLLRDEVQSALKLEKKDVGLNSTTGTIILKVR